MLAPRLVQSLSIRLQSSTRQAVRSSQCYASSFSLPPFGQYGDAPVSRCAPSKRHSEAPPPVHLESRVESLFGEDKVQSMNLARGSMSDIARAVGIEAECRTSELLWGHSQKGLNSCTIKISLLDLARSRRDLSKFDPVKLRQTVVPNMSDIIDTFSRTPNKTRGE